MKKIARYLRLAARYLENLRALRVKRENGTPETYWKLDHIWFHEMNIAAVIDVGANEGQFSRTLRLLLPNCKIFAFEPIPACYERTKRRFARDSGYKLFNVALGEKRSISKFTVSAETGASSLMSMSTLQAKHFPRSLQREEIEVNVERLDDIMATQALAKPYLLKIDVQGYEFQVLQGGLKTLNEANLLILEASYEPFYEGQKLFEEVYDLVRVHGFRLADTFNMMFDPGTGRALQGDFLFVKRN